MLTLVLWMKPLDNVLLNVCHEVTDLGCWKVEPWSSVSYQVQSSYFWDIGLDQRWQIFGTHIVLYFSPHPGQTLLVDHGLVEIGLGASTEFPRQQLLARTRQSRWLCPAVPNRSNTQKQRLRAKIALIRNLVQDLRKSLQLFWDSESYQLICRRNNNNG